MIVIVLSLCFLKQGVGQHLIGWNFSIRPYSKGTETEIFANIIDTNLQPSALTRGNGLNNVKGFNNSFAVGFAKGAESFKEAQENKAYIEFKVIPKRGYIVNLNTLEFKVKCTNHGGINYLWAYSKDGGRTFLRIGTESLAENSAEGIEQPKLDISEIGDVKDSKNGVIFRLYLWGEIRRPGEKSNFAIGRYQLQSSIPSLAIQGEIKPFH